MRARSGAVAVVGVGVAAALALTFAGEREAAAYVQYRGSTGITFSWRPACFPLSIVVYPGTFSHMTNAEVAAAATGAANAWSSAANACTFVSFQVQVVTGAAPRPARDLATTIVFRNDSWCAIDAAGVCSPSLLYDPAARMVSTVYASASTGVIREADIEINAFNFQWADRVTHPELTDRFDLQNHLTQQIGHLLGFDWACVSSPTTQTPRPTDHTGQPAVDCASAPDSIRSATMYPVTATGDIERRTLAADDQLGLCATYPVAASACEPDAGPCTCTPPAAGTDAGQDAARSPDTAVADAGDTIDASAADRTPADAGGDSADDGCACYAGNPSFGRSGAGLLLVWAALVAVTRRRRRD